MTTTDYERNPPSLKATTDYQKNPPSGSKSKKSESDVLHEWVKKAEEAEEDRKQFLPQIRVNRKFAAGKQHLDINHRDGRVVDRHERDGIKMVTADILTQYVQTAVGRMGGNDLRPNFIASIDDELAQMVTEQMNMAFGWGWENEWLGDQKLLQVWRLLVIDGTCAIRCRYDRKFGDVVGDVPYKDNKPLLDKEEAYNYVAEEAEKGRTVKLKTLREGKVVWELLTMENLLPPPGFDDPAEFPWEIVVRPVLIEDLKAKYGEKANDVEEEEIESSASLTSGLGLGDAKDVHLKGRALVYTGYRRPCAEYAKGQVVIFTKTVLLEDRDHLPYEDEVRGPTTGLHYLRWQVIPGRFPGRAFIEGGIGPQKIRNKRLTQIDAIIDRGMPFVLIEEQSLSRRKDGSPMEYVEIRPGAPIPKVESGVPPGAWMLQDVKLQEENAERAMGLSGVSMGQPPQGVSAYSAMALLTENNTIKLDAIAQDVSNVVKELSWDTMEAMKNWPPNKQITVAGPENRLQAFLFNRNIIPKRYLVRMPRVGTMPRSQAAEIQKINDIWTAAGSSGKPLPLEWYVNSLNAGKAQDIPPTVGDQQMHKAQLENIVIVQTGQPIPVSDSDDHAKHGEAHRSFQIPLKSLADLGDVGASKQWAALEAHIQEHLMMAQSATMGMNSPMSTSMGMPQAGPSLPPQNMPQPGGMPNVPQAPSLPSVPEAGL